MSGARDGTKSTAYQTVCAQLQTTPRTWLVTGVAGFIGSNLLEQLLHLQQTVVGLDNFATGSRANLDDVHATVGDAAWSRFRFFEGDIRELEACRAACRGVDLVLHQAALGSVPRSLEDPVTSNNVNIGGTLHMLVAARDAGVQRFVFAASSSAYGDHPALPKVEETIGRPLSPYAVTKYVGELYAEVFARAYGLETVGLRYFNVFGRRQSPDGPYAAVIPRWIDAMLRGEQVTINGSGETSRDFCYVANAVQANLLAATAVESDALNRVYNVAVGARTTLNQLYELLRVRLLPHAPHLAAAEPVRRDFRPGDVMHSLADIDKARRLLGYEPSHTVGAGLDEALPWYLKQSQCGRREA